MTFEVVQFVNEVWSCRSLQLISSYSQAFFRITLRMLAEHGIFLHYDFTTVPNKNAFLKYLDERVNNGSNHKRIINQQFSKHFQDQNGIFQKMMQLFWIRFYVMRFCMGKWFGQQKLLASNSGKSPRWMEIIWSWKRKLLKNCWISLVLRKVWRQVFNVVLNILSTSQEYFFNHHAVMVRYFRISIPLSENWTAPLSLLCSMMKRTKSELKRRSISTFALVRIILKSF